MQLRNASLLSLEVSCVVTNGRRPTWRDHRNTRSTAMILLGGALLVLTSAQTGLAHAEPGSSPKDTSFARTLWAPPGQLPPISTQADPPGEDQQTPPSDEINWIYNEAQWDLPAAPFVFPADTLYTAGSFESTRDIRIDKQAVIHTQAGTTLHLSGKIDNEGTSTQGVAKYGEGTLVLSGHNTYAGNTLLKEGALRVEGQQALGLTYRALDMHRGTELQYAAGATLYNAVPLHDETGLPTAIPLDGSTPSPADSVRFRVDSGIATQAGVINGAVPIVKQGQGTLVLAGPVHKPSYAVVNEGTLSVRDFFGGSMQVNNGARLEGGNATIGHTRLLSGAVLAPGTQGGIDTLYFAQDLEFMPGSRLEVDVTADGQSDQVLVIGKALLDGEVMAQAQDGDWKPSTPYTVLEALGGLDGTFASVATNLAFLTPELSYDDNKVTLTLTRNEVPLDTVGETPTEEEVADVIETEKPTEPEKPVPPVVVETPVDPPAPAPEEPVVIAPPAPEPEVAVVEPAPEPSLYEEIIVMDKPRARMAFNQLSGSWAASVQSQLMEDSRFIREAALHNMPQTGLPTGPPASHHFWHHAFHSAADRNAHEGTPADARDINGLAMGLNRELGRDWHASVYAGFQQSRMRRHNAMAGAKADGVHAGVALARSWSAADFTVGAAHTWHIIDSHRNIAVAAMRHALSARTRARTLQIFSQVTAPLRWLAKPNTTRIEPFARLAWVHHRVDGYKEAGGAAALRVLPNQRSVLFSTLGLKAAHTIETPLGPAQLQGELAWQHASGDVRSFSQQAFRDSIQQTEFRSEGQAVGRQTWALRLGVEARLAKTVSLGIAYAGQFGLGQSGRGRQDHGARLNLAWAF